MRFFSLLVLSASSVILSGFTQSSLLPKEIIRYGMRLSTYESKLERLTKKDYRYIKGQLKDPKKLRALLINDTITFSVDRLSVPQAGEIIHAEVASRRDFTNNAFSKAVQAMLEFPTPMEANARFEKFAGELKEASPESRLAGVNAFFSANPDMKEYISIILDYLGESFNESMVKLVKKVFFISNHHGKNTSLKIQYLFNTIQNEHNLLPEPLYLGIQKAYSSY